MFPSRFSSPHNLKLLRYFSTATAFAPKPIYLVAGKRTPIGTAQGGLSKLSAKDLGVLAIRAALSSINLAGTEVDEVVLGHVYQSGQGQNTARQVSLAAGVHLGAHCTTVSKLCSSGVKSVGYTSMSIARGNANVAVAGGYECMSNVPYLIPNLRKGAGYGNTPVIDGIVRDGLEDFVVNKAMGLLAEKTAVDFKLTREQVDQYAYRSYERAIEATTKGWFKDQIVPVKINDKITISEDEEQKRYNKAKIPTLKPAFSKTGILTAANSSKINDAGCALVLMNEDKVKQHNLKPLARIISFADAALEPVDFTIAPAHSIRKLLKNTGLTVKDIDYWEINEAFAVTVLSNVQMLDIDLEKVNIHGGAIAQGHPVGFSGAKIILGLSEILKQKKAKFGIASVCNAGGGGSSVLIENLQF
jgi:acetyl-CoA C-acetyltransferase